MQKMNLEIPPGCLKTFVWIWGFPLSEYDGYDGYDGNDGYDEYDGCPEQNSLLRRIFISRFDRSSLVDIRI